MCKTDSSRYDIHGGAAEMENGDTLGAPVNESLAGERDANLDLSIPPTHADEKTRTNRVNSDEENLTRVPTPTEAHDGAHKGESKTKNI
jgi:hypothetical protein